MAGEGQAELNRMLINRIERCRDAAVDGLRHPTDYESLLAEFGSQFFMIFVDTSLQIRFERSRDQIQHLRAVSCCGHASGRRNIDLLQPLAAVTISGTMSAEELTSELRRLMASFRQRVAI